MISTRRFHAARHCPDFLGHTLYNWRNAVILLLWGSSYKTGCLYSTGAWLPENTRRTWFPSLKQLFGLSCTAKSSNRASCPPACILGCSLVLYSCLWRTLSSLQTMIITHSRSYTCIPFMPETRLEKCWNLQLCKFFLLVLPSYVAFFLFLCLNRNAQRFLF